MTLSMSNLLEHKDGYLYSSAYLKQVSQEKPLNQFFQEMISGTITEDDLGNLLHG